VAHEQSIDLVTGESRWLRVCRYVLFATTAATLAFAPADPVWRWTGLLGLGLAYVLVSVNLRKMSRIPYLRLLGDGMVTVGGAGQPEINAALGKNSWVTAWMAVVPVICLDHRARLRLLVCRSRNHPQEYRRLLKRLRLGSGSLTRNGILDRA